MTQGTSVMPRDLALVELKEKVKSGQETDEEMGKALAKITTLNITINNRLKSKTDFFEEKSKILEEMLESKKEELSETREELVGRVKYIISENLNSFNKELKELNEIFGIEFSEPELPFDEKKIKLEFSLFPFENKFGEKTGEDGKIFIKSENRNPSKN